MVIEQTIRDYLLTKIQNVPIEVEEPTNAPSKYIVFRVIDQGMEDQIWAVTVEFLCYGASVLEASLINDELKKAMLNIPELDSIFSCNLGGGGYDSDNEQKKHRYRSYFNLYY